MMISNNTAQFAQNEIFSANQIEYIQTQISKAVIREINRQVKNIRR